MSATTINIQALTPDQLVHLQPSPSLSRLGEILIARHQPWSVYRGNDKAKLNQKPYTPSDLTDAIQGLEAYELSRAMVVSCYHGDLEIAQQIWAARGPFETTHVKAKYQELINGTAVRQGTGAEHLFTNSSSIEEIKELLEWAPTVGLGFLVGVGSEHSLLLDSGTLEEPIKRLAHKSAYSGELPTFSGGVVYNPELLVSLRGMRESTILPEAYNDILCWVSNQEVSEFPDHLKPFLVNQGVEMISNAPYVEGVGFERRVFSFAECTDDLMSQVERRSIENAMVKTHAAGWKFNALEMRVEPAAGLDGYPSDIVLGYLASEPIKYGFDHKPGHTLCHTSVEFLSGFPVSSTDPEKARVASAFSQGYFPLDLLSLSREGPSRFFAGCLRRNPGLSMGYGRGHSNVRDLNNTFGDASPIKDQVRKALPRPLVDFLNEFNCQINLDGRSMLSLWQGLGIDNTKFGAQLNSWDLQTLHDAGYRFSDATVTHLPQRFTSTGKQLTFERWSSVDTEVYLSLSTETVTPKGTPQDLAKQTALDNAYHNALRMNLWPAETPRPESLRKALIQAAAKKKPGDTNQERAMRAWFDLEGIENCVKAADTVSQVDFVRRHFGHNEVKPYLNLTTRKIRGSLIADDLGL